MREGKCVICGKAFIYSCGRKYTCSDRCSYEKNRLNNIEYQRQRRRRNKKAKSTLLEIQQKAREAGMSYGMYMAVTKGGMAIERSEADEKSV